MNRKELYLIVCIGLVVRFLLLPFATTDSADPISRIWIAWRWLSDPEIITHGIWAPLHFYLIALSMVFVEDTVFPPVLIHIIFSVATPIPLYIFTKNEFGNHRASMFIAVTYIFYPIALSNSLMETSEVPFVFFLVLCLMFLSTARGEQGSWKHALGAGIALTFAGMLRYEGWILIPLLSILLWDKPKFMTIFIASSMIQPLFWMLGNGIHHGDPLYSFHSASRWQLDIEGANENLSVATIFRRLIYYPGVTYLGMSPVLALFSFVGSAISVKRRRRYILWLIPPLGLMCLFIIAAVKGSLALKPKYTVTMGTLLFPFSAVLYKNIGIGNFKKWKRLTTELTIIGSIVLFSVLGISNSPILYPFRPMSPIPRFNQQDEIEVISAITNENIGKRQEGFICDFFGWQQSYFVALMTRLHPNNIFMAPGARHQKLSTDNLYDFINNHKRGILLINEGSRFAKAIEFHDSGQARVGNIVLSLDMIQSIPLKDTVIGIYHYKIMGMR